MCILMLQRSSGSAGAQVNVVSRASCGPGKLTLHPSGGLPRIQIHADSI